jgi:TnpA family transposase
MENQGKRISILSLPEAREFYSVPKFTADERDYFFTFTDDELKIAKRLNKAPNRVHFLLMLGYFKVKKVCLIYGWKKIEADYNYIVDRYFPQANKHNKNIDRDTRSRLYNIIFDFKEYNRCDQSIQSTLLSDLIERAAIYIDETQLFKDAIHLLKSMNVAIPKYSTMQTLLSKAIGHEENRIAILIQKHLSEKKQSEYRRLINKDEPNYRLKDLKKLPKSYKSGEVQKEIKRHKLLSELYASAYKLVKRFKLSQGNIRYYATLCTKYNINRLNELKNHRALLYLTCFVVTRYQISNDSLAQAFLVAYSDFSDKVKICRDEMIQEQTLKALENIENVPLILDLFMDNSINDETTFGLVRERAFKLIPEDNMSLVRQNLANIKPNKLAIHWEAIDKHYRKAVTNLRPLLLVLDMGCRSNTILSSQVSAIRKQLDAHKGYFIIDGRLIKKQDKPYFETDASSDEKLKKCVARRSEIYLYSLINQGLLNGDVYIKDSLEYRNFDDYLVNNKIWKERQRHLIELGLEDLNRPVDDHLGELETILNDKLVAVGQRILEGKNNYVKRKSNSELLMWSRAVKAKNENVTERFFNKFDRKSIIHVLRKVSEETGFLQHLKPKSSRNKKATASIEHLLACLIANGTFQGTLKFSTISGQQYKLLQRTEADCFHEEALRQAIDEITSAAVHLPIFDEFRLDDENIHASADGQRFESKYANPLVDYCAKYFGMKKGAIVYTLVSSHFAINGRVISPRSHESHHLFDMVYNASSALKANIVSTDTHGTNQFNHAILNTFNYQFTPRYAGFKKRFLDEFNVKFDQENILSLNKSINFKLIKKEWNNIVKIMLSLGMRTVQQSTLVKKLCSYKKHNSTTLALAEYNRLLKCLYYLDYVDDSQLRHVIHTSLNQGEQLHGLKRALAALGGNQFRGSSPEEMQIWNACADLLANCIVYYNAMIMSSVKEHCHKNGENDYIKLFKSISPVSWEHISLNGFYDVAENDEFWDVNEEIESLEFIA